MAKLTALAVKNAKPGRHGDGAGLYLLVKPSGAKSWVLRVQKHGKRRDIGLGSVAALTLAEARERAAELRKHALNGRDPVAERDRDIRPTPSFREATIETHAALKPSWVEKNAAAFLTSLETYAHPTLGDLRVDSIKAAHILSALTPIWIAKPELARKVRMRIGQVLNFAHSKGWRAAEAPNRAVSLGLPKQPKGRNFSAMPYEQVPKFVAGLQKNSPTAGRRALLFLILTAARPGEVRHARWEQFDLAKSDWNRPPEIMKEREAHTITLNAAAVGLLKELQGSQLPSKNGLVFPGARGNPLSDMTMRKVLRDAGLPFDAHGFRSSFRDWAAEQMPAIPDAVAEAALAHAVPDKIVRAYRRTKFVSMRRELLEAWAKHIFEGQDIEQS
ncbi:integrase arm-type DNA-binding domain-containing protein [Qipengyuania sp. G39]|uniref:Integrase arm-type DNA-binding domain-containing protein n=1 Tax=Qipengyuania profundimaris TaxID=3067652 RepID=A0ABT9HL35_9SPHN|nr:integrase arm-type DNA-binding domain-containing protein [Qipengyuania sp. G39]MDP4573863.1 integrase arm-type DNA-binding domain-containing protein [Qipengyuania sp. G39]